MSKSYQEEVKAICRNLNKLNLDKTIKTFEAVKEFGVFKNKDFVVAAIPNLSKRKVFYRYLPKEIKESPEVVKLADQYKLNVPQRAPTR